jgi:NitT/TauT family transport system substrate-binding protein
MLVACLVAATLSSAPADEAVLHIGSMPWVGWSPLDVAEDQGFWDDLGLAAEVVHFPNSYLMHDAMFVGEADVAFSMLGQIIDVHRTVAPVVILGETNWSHGGDVLMTQPGFDLATAPAMTPIGLYIDGPALKYFVELALRREGSSLDHFRLVVIRADDLVPQFRAGRIQAGTFFGPYMLEAAAAGGVALATSADFPGCIPEGPYTFVDRLETIGADRLEALFRGWLRGLAWQRDPANHDEFFRILRERTLRGFGEFSDADLETMLAAVRLHQPSTLVRYNSPGGAAADYIDRVQRHFPTEPGADPAHLLDARFLLAALADEVGE